MKRSFSILLCLLLGLMSCAYGEQLPQTPIPTLSSGALDVLAVDHKLYELGYQDPEYMHNAPHNAQIARPDEVRAARNPVVRWVKA